MAQITITIPNTGDVIDTLLGAANDYLAANNIDTTGMTNVQKAQRYVTELLRAVYIARKREASQATHTTAVQTEVATAQTTAQANIT